MTAGRAASVSKPFGAAMLNAVAAFLGLFSLP